MEKKYKTVHKTRRVFKSRDFNSGDGMLTAVWGPSLWHFLHIMSFNYPMKPSIEDMSHYKNFMLSLQFILPCKYCRQNLLNYYIETPITSDDMADRASFSRYVYTLHECINKRLNKPHELSYYDVRERYEHFRSRCVNDNSIKLFPIKKETGCTIPLYGEKSKCVIKIVPQTEKCKTIQIDKKCLKHKLHSELGKTG